MRSTRHLGSLALAVALCLASAPGSAADDETAPVADDAAAEMARKLQDPLATIRALMTDNAIGFDTGDDNGTSFGFQLQPIYALDFADEGFSLVLRGVFPVMGLEPGTDNWLVGEPTESGSDRVWGLGDSFLQFFFAPKTAGGFKWGVGPQFSLRTRTDQRLGGPSWGAGPVAIVVGEITEAIAFAGIVANHWSFDGSYNTATIHPMLFYNFASLPGAYVAYNAITSADWEAPSSNRWIVPLGLSAGKAFDMGDGHGLDLAMGPYYNVVRPDGAAGWQLRIGATWVFP